MAYSEQVLHRARARLEQAKAEREQENAAHRADAYARYPRLAEIDNELRRTMAELMAAALQRGEDPSQASGKRISRSSGSGAGSSRPGILTTAIWTTRPCAPSAAGAAMSARRCARACASCAGRSRKRS